MNAVATPPKSARAGELRTAPARAPAAQPEWQSLLACLLNDIREVLANVAEIGDKIGPDEPAICTLLDCALEDIYKVKHNLEARPLYVATTDAAYEALHKPLAHLQGAAAMTRLMGVDIFSGAIEKATALLDEAHNGLSDQALGKLLPVRPVEPANADAEESPAPGNDETAAEAAYYRCGEVVAVMIAAAREDSSTAASEVCWAIVTIAEIAKDLMEPRGTLDIDDVRTAAARLSQAIAICDLLMVESESDLVRAGHTLLIEAAQHVDDAEAEALHAQRP